MRPIGYINKFPKKSHRAKKNERGTLESHLVLYNTLKQAGTGPSRRHIQGSKIAKRLPSVKYSFTEVENRKFFDFFLKKLHTKKIGPSGAPVFQHPFCRKA